LAAGISIDTTSLARLTRQTRNLLAFHLELGITGYPSTPALADFLKKDYAGKSTGKSLKKSLKKSVGKSVGKTAVKTAGESAGKTAGKSAVRQLETIAGELAGCRTCESLSGPAVPGQGSAGPVLFVIGDCCRSADNDTAVIWSAEEDDLFWKMMAAIGLDRDLVYVTNCIKCGCNNSSPPGAEFGRNCFSFLERELTAVQPALICTMGELAAGLLLGSRTPLVRMRGRFHQYRYPRGGIARVMPTFHPAFLLRHPEMKRAAWMDLQALQRQLKGR